MDEDIGHLVIIKDEPDADDDHPRRSIVDADVSALNSRYMIRGELTSSDVLDPDSQQRRGLCKRKVVRFSLKEDLFLLREVLSVNPFEQPGRWALIAARMKGISEKDYNRRNCRERTDYLMKMFKKGERSIQKKFGTKEEYSQRENLLKKAVALLAKTIPLKRGKRSKSESDEEEGKRLKLTFVEEAVRPSTDDSQVHYNGYSPLCDSESSNQMTPSQTSQTLPSSPPRSPLEDQSEQESKPQVPPSPSPSPLLAEPDDVPPSSPVPMTSSNNLPNPSTSSAASGRTKYALDGTMMEYVGKIQESDREVQRKTIELELLKAQNENLKLKLEERKQIMLFDAQEKRMAELEKKIDSLFEFQNLMQNAFSLEKKIDNISESQNKLLSLLTPIIRRYK